jgi:hypothetical protein
MMDDIICIKDYDLPPEDAHGEGVTFTETEPFDEMSGFALYTVQGPREAVVQFVMNQEAEMLDALMLLSHAEKVT